MFGILEVLKEERRNQLGDGYQSRRSSYFPLTFWHVFLLLSLFMLFSDNSTHELACPGHITTKKDRLRESWHWSRLGAGSGRGVISVALSLLELGPVPKSRLDSSLISGSSRAQKYHFSQPEVKEIRACVQCSRPMACKISSTSDFMTLVVIVVQRHRRHLVSCCKGAPPVVLPMCAFMWCSFIRHFNLFECSSNKTNTINSIHACQSCLT